jgi:hypothetical protein
MDALLLEVSPNAYESSSTSTHTLTPQMKRRKSVSPADLDVEEEEKMLYGEPVAESLSSIRSSVTHYRYDFKVTDTVSVFGPVLDSLFSSSDEGVGISDVLRSKSASSDVQYIPAPTASSYIISRDLKDYFYACAGVGEQSGLINVISGLKTAKVAHRDIPGATSIKSVIYSGGDQPISYVFVSLDRSRVFKYEMLADKLNITEVY